MYATIEKNYIESENHKASAHCSSTCPQCGSALYYTKTGCLCRGSFDHNCKWNCENCNPRIGTCK